MMGGETGDQSQLFYLFNLEERIPAANPSRCALLTSRFTTASSACDCGGLSSAASQPKRGPFQ
jgi:hypothetical protein